MSYNYQYFLYKLCDPISNEIKYIGVTNNPFRRYNEHLKDKEKNHKRNWIYSLRKKSLLPVFNIIDSSINIDEIFNLEKLYINDLKLLGVKLTNATIGGEAPMLGKKHSEKTKHLMSQKRIGTLNNFYGKKHSEEFKKKLSESRKGIPNGRKGIKLTEEHKQRLRKPHGTAHNKGKSRFDLVLMEKMLNEGYKQSYVASYFKTDQGTISRYKIKHNFKIK